VSPRTAHARRPDDRDSGVDARRHGVLGALAAALPDRARREERPELRVVEPASRRRRGWQVGTIAGLLLFLALFAVAGAHTLIVQQQRHIDDVNARIASAEEEAEALEVALAELQSPERIVREARERLGMVPAPSPVYLRPAETDDARAAEVPPPTPTTVATTPSTARSTTAASASTTKTSTPTGTATTPTTAASTGTTTAGSAGAGR